MTIDPTVQRALDNLRTVNWDHLGAGELADAEQLVVERIQSAYRSALVGETFPDDAASEAEFATCEADAYGWDGYHTEDAVRHARMFRRQRNALLVQLQDKEERIKALEAFIAIPGGPMTTDLDFERAENETLCVPIEDIDKEISAECSEARYLAFNANLQAQHRAIVAPLKARIAELEGVSCGYCRGLKRLNEEAP